MRPITQARLKWWCLLGKRQVVNLILLCFREKVFLLTENLIAQVRKKVPQKDREWSTKIYSKFKNKDRLYRGKRKGNNRLSTCKFREFTLISPIWISKLDQNRLTIISHFPFFNKTRFKISKSCQIINLLKSFRTIFLYKLKMEIAPNLQRFAMGRIGSRKN